VTDTYNQSGLTEELLLFHETLQRLECAKKFIPYRCDAKFAHRYSSASAI